MTHRGEGRLTPRILSVSNTESPSKPKQHSKTSLQILSLNLDIIIGDKAKFMKLEAHESEYLNSRSGSFLLYWIKSTKKLDSASLVVCDPKK